MEGMIRQLSFLILGAVFFVFPVWAEEAAPAPENPAVSLEQASKTAEIEVVNDSDKAEEEKFDLRYLTKEEIKTYKLRPADVIAIDVYNESDLSREVQVDRKGFVNYPLIGRVKVEGLIQEEVENTIRDLFAKDYLVNPLVSMRFVIDQTPTPTPPAAADIVSEVIETDIEEEVILVSYIVLGEVKKPGTYEFDSAKGKMSLLKAISIAGGFSDIANMSKIKLLRREGETTKSLTINAKDIISGKKADEDIKPDDLIVVPESFL